MKNKKTQPKLAFPAKDVHNDLIPRGAIADLQGRNGAAMSPDTRPMLQVTPSVASVLQRGIADLTADLENARVQWDRAASRAERADQVMRIYLEFVENVSKSKRDAAYIRDAATHLLGIMY